LSKVRADGQETNIQEVGAMAAGRGKDGEEKGSNRFEFTDKSLRAGKRITPAAPGRRKFYWDTLLPGFALRVGDAISKERVGTLCLVTRIPGKKSSSARAIGVFPGETTLAGARDLARAMKADIRQGIDPKEKAAKQRRDEERRRADTVQAAFDAFAAEHLSRLRTGDEVRRTFANHVLPAWSERPISEIRRADVKVLIQAVHQSAPIASNRVLAAVKTFLGWCAQEELIEASPAASVKPLAAETKRDRVLSDLEIRAIWQACEELGVFGRYFRFLLVTGARRSEAAAATWSEIDVAQRLWTLPQSRSKNKRQHILPLNDMALAILAECPRTGEHVFTTNGRTPISGWSKAKATLDRLAGERLRALAAERGEEQPPQIAEWRLHDCRRTFATGLAQLRVDRETVRELLNHSDSSVTAVYDRWRRQPEKVAAMDAWSRRLTSIVSGTPEGNVIALATARG
jgi:integrase